MGFTPPVFAHLPLLLNRDGSKFSKRQQSLSVESLRENGILPKSLINFIIHLSSGFHNKESNQSYELEELVNKVC